MNELFFDSLTLNSIGLIIIGLALLITHFWNKRKLSRDTDIVVIDGMKESLALKLLRARLLIAGFALAIGGIVLTVFNYNQTASDFYVQLIDDTYDNVMRSASTSSESREVLRTMERTVPLSFLSEYITSEIELWNSSENNLAAINQGKPVCVKLYEMYVKKGESEKVRNLERIYDKFFRSYYGETHFTKMINDREERRKANEVYAGAVKRLLEE